MVMGTPLVTLYVLPKEGKKPDAKASSTWRPLVGFVVAKKVSKSACKRNRAKRRIREVYRLLRTEIFDGKRDDIKLRDWYALVFVAHEPALEASYESIKESVTSVLVRASGKTRQERRGQSSAKS